MLTLSNPACKNTDEQGCQESQHRIHNPSDKNLCGCTCAWEILFSSPLVFLWEEREAAPHFSSKVAEFTGTFTRLSTIMIQLRSVFGPMGLLVLFLGQYF